MGMKYDIDKINEMAKVNNIIGLTKLFQSLIFLTAKKLINSKVGFDDLMSEGHIGLLKAIGSYTEGNFSSFAYSHIQWAMLDYIQKYSNIVTPTNYNRGGHKNIKFESEFSIPEDTYMDNYDDRDEISHFKAILLINIDKLSEIEKELITEVFFKQQTRKEVMLKMNLDKPKFGTIYYGALKKLRKMMTK